MSLNRRTLETIGARLRRRPRAGAALIAAGAALVGGALVPTPGAAGATAGFTVTGPLATPRTNAVAATLADGDVLVAGGETAGGTPLSSAELFDPATNTWQTVGSLPLPVTDATATRLKNGDVLVAGGLTTGSSASVPTGAAEIYNPASRSWQTTGALPQATTDASAALIGNGDVLYAGGLTAAGNSAPATDAVALYNPSSGTWSTGPQLPTAVAGAVAAPLGNGGVLVAGGETAAGGAPSASTETYASGTWTTAPDMPTPASDAASVVLSDGRVFVAGGRDSAGTPTAALRLFDPASRAWSTAAPLPIAVAAPGVVRLASGAVLVAGGMTGGSQVTTAAALFDPTHGTWSQTAPLALGVGHPVAAPLGAADALIASGTTASGVTSESERFVSGSEPVITSAASFQLRDDVFARLTLRATGTPAPSITLQGTLPPGMVFSGGAGGVATISGRPEAPGTYTVTLHASNGVGATASQQLRIVVGAVPHFTTASRFALVAGRHARILIHAAGSPVPVLRLLGALPRGLTFTDIGNGSALVRGTPQRSGRASVAVRIVATNTVGRDVIQRIVFTFSAAPAIRAPGRVTVTGGRPVTIRLSASGRPTPILTLSGRLPAGLSFHRGANGTARITGRPAPTVSGTFNVTVHARNGVGRQAAHRLVIVTRPASSPQGIGYWSVARNGRVLAKGAAHPVAPRSRQNPRDIVAMAALANGRGYLLASSFGGVFVYGDAVFRGSITHLHLRTPVVAIAVTHSGGYVLVTRRGNVFNFGGARFYGSLAGRRVGPVAGITLAPDDRGYWLVTTSGRVYAFGAARNYGSAPPRRSPAVAIAATPNGRGYWIVFRNGAIVNRGNARFFGSLAHRRVPPVTAFAPTGNARGYWVVTRRGNVFNFGNARFLGSWVHMRLSAAVMAFAPRL